MAACWSNRCGRAVCNVRGICVPATCLLRLKDTDIKDVKSVQCAGRRQKLDAKKASALLLVLRAAIRRNSCWLKPTDAQVTCDSHRIRLQGWHMPAAFLSGDFILNSTLERALHPLFAQLLPPVRRHAGRRCRRIADHRRLRSRSKWSMWMPMRHWWRNTTNWCRYCWRAGTAASAVQHLSWLSG